ncbi:JDVT-CTERM system glutamic-type intramembrane protease [Marinobacter lacisalsi]|uniref:JDVT-CTERM system glutamic-type intramembrane protease n=1 Tax=Marinobacter lacisalsi TaxID=475979 RepID=A0ABV8QGJ5_9GAMM
MKHSNIPRTLGFRPATGLLTDRLFWAAISAGLIVSALLAAGELTGAPRSIDVYTLASLLVWYPAIEELTFRGVIQGTLAETTTGRKKWLGLSVANVAATFAFTLWHLLYQGAPIIITLAFPSLVFGFFRDRYQSLVPTLLLHSLYNGLFLAAHWLYT